MTEEEWMKCEDPTQMLEFLRGKMSDRKLTLYACACCRSVKHLLIDTPSLRAIEIAEENADGTTTENERLVAFKDVSIFYDTASNHVAYESIREDEREFAIDAVEALFAVMSTVGEGGINAAFSASCFNSCNPDKNRTRERQCFSILLRCIFGNPFRPIALNPLWLTPTVKQLATVIYEDRQWDKMPLLGDALQDTGCDNEDILKHLRSGGEHVKGCWALDILLGKS